MWNRFDITSLGGNRNNFLEFWRPLESRVNPVAQSFRENYHPVDEISPVSNDVFVVIYVFEVDLSGVLISRTVLKTFITIKFVQFKIEEY